MVALLGAVALGAWGQSRQTQQAPATPATTPGRGGRGGVPGPGPAVGGEVDETPVVTHHSIQVNGKTLAYTATVAQMPIKDAAGETEAHIFYVAYSWMA
uniref:Peptidase S10, serine carboxypeptidase n=1 Tax=Solibacter usitatus (strain Ellin6076) TaxID=234267 RepID=Q027Q5_SOLUE